MMIALVIIHTYVTKTINESLVIECDYYTTNKMAMILLLGRH